MSSAPKKLTLVTVDNYYEEVTSYIASNELIISDYDDMTGCVLRMIREGYCFNMDKNLLRGFLEDLTYMYSPNDDKNKDRIVNMLEESDDDDSDSDDGGDDDHMAKMMQMLMGGGGVPAVESSSVESEVDEVDEKSCSN